MIAFAVLLVAGAAAAELTVENHGNKFELYGAPIPASYRVKDVAMDGLLVAEAEGWRSVYDKPFILTVQQDNKPELVSFLVKNGLAGLPHSADTRFLHELLKNGNEKAGIMLSATKYLAVPEVEYPITRMILPQEYNLNIASKMLSEFNTLPTVFVVSKEHLRMSGIEKLTKIGEFNVIENAIKVAADIPSPVSNILAEKFRASGYAKHGSEGIITSPISTYSIPATSELDVSPHLYRGSHLYSTGKYFPTPVEDLAVAPYPIRSLGYSNLHKPIALATIPHINSAIVSI